MLLADRVLDALATRDANVGVGDVIDLPRNPRRDAEVDEEVHIEEDAVHSHEQLFTDYGTYEPGRYAWSARSRKKMTDGERTLV